MSTIASEAARFREWAALQGFGSASRGEWESDYPHWEAFYSAVEQVLTATEFRSLKPDDLDSLLYALARDNEDEQILETLERFPDIAVQVVVAATQYPDTDARWQGAVLAGRIGRPDLLEPFLDDNADYVRRRARLALRKVKDAI